MQLWPRTILHADMDAFFAAVEQLDRPELRGRPLIVGHRGPRSVVTTASYEARPFGVGSAMPMAQALRRCPQAVVVEPRFARYREISEQVLSIFASFSPRVEALSLDEAYLDMTGCERLFGPPEAMVHALRAAVREKTGLTVSVGASTTKFVAKIASDFRKPDGWTLVPPDEVVAFLRPLPVRKLPGVGPKAEERLHQLGLRTVGDLGKASASFLEAELGSTGRHLHRLARGEDSRQVVPDREAKSIGAEETLAHDVLGEEAIRPWLRWASEKVAVRLRRAELRARGVRVKLKTAGFRIHTRQTRLPVAVDAAQPIYEAALRLLPAFPLEEPMRLVGVTAYDFGGHLEQGDLFATPALRRSTAVDAAIDAVRSRFGAAALRRGSDPS